MRTLASLLLIGCGSAVAIDAGSGSDAGTDSAPIDGGPSCTVLDWDPAAPTITRWPEPAIVIDDATTETGHRLRFDAERYPMLALRLGGYLPTLTDDLSEVDGFGVTSEAYFMFGRAFDPIPQTGLGFAILGPGTPYLEPAIVTASDRDRTLMLAPMHPLPARSTIAVYVTRAVASGCIEASAAMQQEIEASSAVDPLRTLGAITAASDLVALTVYETESIEEDTLAVAADISTRDIALAAPPTCTDDPRWLRCDALLVAGDYRDENGRFVRAAGAGTAPLRTYQVPVTFWLPKEATPPYPTIVYGHGLGGDHNQAERLAEFAAPNGIATVAMPALMHGSHPTHLDPGESNLLTVLGFFGVSTEMLRTRALDAIALREHFRQTTWDRLQLTRFLIGDPDIDGDAASDIDGSRLAYLGVSLGGLMGPEFLAASDHYGAGVLVVPGGRVSTIISDSALFGSLITLLRPPGATDGDVRRFFPILQTILDKGDPAAYGVHILEHRFTASRTPSVLVGVVLDDEVVPNVANYTLGRALRIPIVQPLLRSEVGFDVVPAPLSGNFESGMATGGLLQFDIVGDGMGGTRMAAHDNIGDSDVGSAAWLDFLSTHWNNGLARIRDPYAAIGITHP